jgi:phage baseplate assembly protein W
MDLYHYFGQDLTVNQVGDLLLADGVILSQQRILRRLLTNPGEYIWEPSYGAGVPSYIGQALTPALKKQITGLITSQMYLEPTVLQTPPPVVTLTAQQNAIFVYIQYVDSTTNTVQVLYFKVS